MMFSRCNFYHPAWWAAPGDDQVMHPVCLSKGKHPDTNEWLLSSEWVWSHIWGQNLLLLHNDIWICSLAKKTKTVWKSVLEKMGKIWKRRTCIFWKMYQINIQALTRHLLSFNRMAISYALEPGNISNTAKDVHVGGRGLKWKPRASSPNKHVTTSYVLPCSFNIGGIIARQCWKRIVQLKNRTDVYC